MADPQREADIRASLKIPAGAKSVVLLAQNSHLDWDWRASFRGYLLDGYDGQASVQAIFTRAFQLMREGAGTETEIPYYYSVAEMGFLQAFLEMNPAELEDFSSAIGDRLRIVGGGITSPDNLLPHGEAFLRNYLLGAAWAAEALGLPAREAWIPDDFGHDAQLPVLVRALGFEAAAFGRLPGWNNGVPLAEGSPADQVMKDSCDFFWESSDGSTILAHYLQGGYCQGGGIANTPTRGYALKQLRAYVHDNARNSGTSYIFVSVGCDFTCPVEIESDDGPATLRDIATWWNEDVYKKDPATWPYAVAASFDFYVDLLLATSDWRTSTSPRPFYPTPFLTGFYASRPENKILHQRATRALLAAETFGMLADSAGESRHADVVARQADLRAVWSDLLPSTHHDYITGTASGSPETGGPIYPDDQVPLLWNAVSGAEAIRDLAVAQIAGRVDLSHIGGSAVPVVVANALGWERRGVAEISSMPPVAAGSPSGRLQATAEGGVLFLCDGVQPFGYSTTTLPAEDDATASHGASIERDGDTYVLSNEFLTARIAPDGGDWVISSLIDEAGGGSEVFPAGGANQLQFFHDPGTIYNFGHENFYGINPHGTFELDTGVTFTNPTAQILESGPLRVRLLTEATVNVAEQPYAYEREYTLVTGEPFVRVRARGAAPPSESGYSVGIRFPVAPGTTRLAYGTTYHWDDADALKGWIDPSPPFCVDPVFQVIHDFVLPESNGSPIFGLYSDSIMAWSLYRQDETLLGIPWRNNPLGTGHGAQGPDPWTHTHHYAVRVPTGLAPPATGAPLREARELQTPLMARVASPASASTLPAARSVATIESVSDGACVLLTTAKAGTRSTDDLILRFYKPSNGVQPVVEVSIDRAVLGARDGDGVLLVRGVTALETELASAETDRLQIRSSASSFTFCANRALTTLAISTGGSRAERS